MVLLGWMVLTLVFVDELLAVAAYAVWGWHHDPQGLLVWLLPVLAIVVWSQLASPKAPYGDGWRRPAAKVVVIGLATVALWDVGHHGWALALLAFSVVVNGAAQVPSIAALATSAERTRA